MFPDLEHSEDLLFRELSVLEPEVLVDHTFLESSNLTTNKRHKRSKSDFKENKHIEETTKDCNIHRKVMHRDIERQRRKEMATLYSSLRSLLPLEYVKGKRSISDHMLGAANYIKQIERSINELRMRRDKLEKLSNSSVGSSENGSSINNYKLPNCVTVNSCKDGVEILITCGIKEEDGFLLSRLLRELLEIGLNVVSCISTKANEKFLYKIQSKVNDLSTNVNLPELQQRLANEINFG